MVRLKKVYTKTSVLFVYKVKISCIVKFFVNFFKKTQKMGISENDTGMPRESEILNPATIGGIAMGTVGGLILIAILTRFFIVWKKRKNVGKYNPKEREEKVGELGRKFNIPGLAYIPSPERLI